MKAPKLKRPDYMSGGVHCDADCVLSYYREINALDRKRGRQFN